ncbi:hypothetical protein OUZ56_017580 [Daphnia magna]|uniref:Uncharacterized protein n=1 Tax=Daphnia magna TaxID=35525 RepID=A0ABR0ATB9_9CRUS|nr:hypothetical protein OUZ56_017580 [Daphnia magna]
MEWMVSHVKRSVACQLFTNGVLFTNYYLAVRVTHINVSTVSSSNVALHKLMRSPKSMALSRTFHPSSSSIVNLWKILTIQPIGLGLQFVI